MVSEKIFSEIIPLMNSHSGLEFIRSMQEKVSVVEHKSWKVIMEQGWDWREAYMLFLLAWSFTAIKGTYASYQKKENLVIFNVCFSKCGILINLQELAISCILCSIELHWIPQGYFTTYH